MATSKTPFDRIAQKNRLLFALMSRASRLSLATQHRIVRALFPEVRS